MGKTIRKYKDSEYPDKSRKKTGDRKRFVHRGDGWATASQGGPGNKAAWAGRSGIRVVDRIEYNKLKDFPSEFE